MVNCLNTNDTEVECDFHGLSFQKPQYQQHGQGHSLHHRKEKEKRARGKNKKEKNESEIEVDFSSLAKRLQGLILSFVLSLDVLVFIMSLKCMIRYFFGFLWCGRPCNDEVPPGICSFQISISPI